MQQLKRLRATFDQTDVFALQEAHGTSGEIEGALFEQATQSDVFVCAGVDRNAGGTAMLSKKQLLKDKDAAHHFQMVQGGAHAVKVWSADVQFSNTTINGHNFGLSEEDLKVISLFARSVDAPLHGCGSMRPAQARAQSAGMLITLRCYLSHGRKRQPPHSWMRPHLPRLWCLATPADRCAHVLW